MRQKVFTTDHSRHSGSWRLSLSIFSFLILSLIPASIVSAKTVQKKGAPDLPNVYGIVAVYELGFNHPWTRSGHTVWVGNRENFDVIYTYEFQHGIQGFNHPDYEDKKLIQNRKLDKDGGRNDWMRDDDYLGLKVDDLPLLIPNLQYTVHVYTRFDAHKKRVPRLNHTWYVDDSFPFTIMR